MTRFPHVRSLSFVGAVLALAGCVMDGRYVVRGTVSGEEGGRAAPIVGAQIKVGTGRTNASALTSIGGSFTAEYLFGGMWLFIEGRAPLVEVSAAGYLSHRFALLGTEDPPGVTRRPCGTSQPPRCFFLDVVLVPQAQEAARLLHQRQPGLTWQEAGSLVADVTGDGIPDLVLLGVGAGSVAVGIVSGPVRADSKLNVFTFTIGADRQDAVCGPAENAKLTLEDLGLPPDELGCDGPSPPPGCAGVPQMTSRFEVAKQRGTSGLRLESGDCDAFHLYVDEGELHWWRR